MGQVSIPLPSHKLYLSLWGGSAYNPLRLNERNGVFIKIPPPGPASPLSQTRRCM